MKKILSLFLVLALYSPVLAGQGMMPGPGSITHSAGQAAAYFGNNATDTPTEQTNKTIYNGSATFTCPGTGTRTLDSLDIYIQSYDGGSSCAYRVGIGTDASPSTIIAYSAWTNFTNGTPAWRATTSFTGSTSLTGGTNYKLFFATAGDQCKVGMGSAGTGVYLYNTDGATITNDGFGATEATNGTNMALSLDIRAHVAAVP
jgi:hypothetical protein